MSTSESITTASDTATTIAGIAVWALLLATYLALILFTLKDISHASLTPRARTYWIWLVVLAPLVGAILWFRTGRPRRTPAG